MSWFDRHDWPDVEIGDCPVTGDEGLIIVYESGDRECYHCGAEVAA